MATSAAAVQRESDRERERERQRERESERERERESVSLWFRLLSCHARMLAELRRELEGNVTMPRFDLLASLLRHDGQTLAALSRDLLVTAGNVTGLVDRAERDGLVARRPDPADRRLARVWLTDDGRALISDLLPAHAAQVHALMEGMPAAQRRELRRLLGALRDHLAGRTPGARANGTTATGGRRAAPTGTKATTCATANATANASTHANTKARTPARGDVDAGGASRAASTARARTTTRTKTRALERARP